ncbi:AraC family transcriptional regulator [Prolixibacteraceae bacterium Z1-6]|uniref:AraC family transcriptional regulator n=1 Tax=Draconibacterium aestuarii TaxID=2998507 RepID=A0A9X3F6D7_9BACT|nr:AraC family transcriptional regulator [Prolixibacteraceae bacterium Z1-6]
MPTVLHIKNMVCPRCIETVDGVFSAMDFEVRDIKLGKVEINKEPTGKQLQELSELLLEKGFELLIDKKSKIINQVKAEIISLIHHQKNEILPVNLSEHLSKLIGADYSSISHLFSSEEEITIEKFVIKQKIERVKELLSYGELTTSEIAFSTGYSSVAHLSSQFKKETGMTPGQFRNLKNKERKSLDQIGN